MSNTTTWHFADRNYIAPAGTARSNRNKKYNLQDRFHPMISQPKSGAGSTTAISYDNTPDYFRNSGARYYSWRAGTGPGSYTNYGYLSDWGNDGSIYTAGGQHHWVGYTVAGDDTDSGWDSTFFFIVEGAGNYYYSTHGWGIGMWTYIENMFGDSFQQTGTPETNPEAFYPNVPYSSVSAFSTPTDDVLREHVTITIEANSDGWLAASTTPGVGTVKPQYHELDAGPPPVGDPNYVANNPDEMLNNWHMWQTYVLGSDDSRLSETWYGNQGPSNIKIPGLFGGRTLGNRYYDHNFTINVPTNNDTAQITPQYTYYNNNYENYGTSPTALETLMPNHYVVMSVAKNGTDWAWGTSDPDDDTPNIYENSLYAGYGGGPIKDILGLYGYIGGDVVSDDVDLFNNAGIPFGQIQAGPQTPDSLLSRFGRTNFSALPAPSASAVTNFNKHIGFSSRIVRGQNSIFQEMGASTNTAVVPYGIDINLTNMPQSEFLRTFEEGPLTPGYTDAMVDYFLYEIMKANIFGYTNPEVPIGLPYSDPAVLRRKYPAYHNISLSAKEVRGDGETDKGNYYGFDWTGADDANWSDNSTAEARAPFSLRAINFNHLIQQWYQHIGRDFAVDQIYNGLIGQTENKFVADGTGFIVGRGLRDSPTSEETVAPAHYKNVLPGDTALEDVYAALVDMGEYLETRMRTFRDVYTGVPCFTDTIAYRVEKYAVDPDGLDIGEPIQNFYIPAVVGDDASNSTIKFFDSQVFYNKKYRYKVYAYKLVIGNQYYYRNAEVFPPAETAAYSNNMAVPLGFDPNVDLIFPATAAGSSLSADAPIGAPREILDGMVHVPFYDYAPTFSLDPSQPHYVDVMINGKRMASQQVGAGSTGAAGQWALLGSPGVGLENEVEEAITAAIQAYVAAFVEGDATKKSNTIYYNSIKVKGILHPGYTPGQVGHVSLVLAKVNHLRVGNQVNNIFSVDLMNRVHAINPAVMPNPWDTAGGIQVSPGIGQSTVVDVGSLMTNFDVFFGLDHRSLHQGPRENLEVMLQFRTGQHGVSPSIPWDTDQEGTAKVDVKNYSSIQIIEIPYVITNAVNVHDLPPMYPDVNFYPVRYKSDKIKILLNQNNFRYSAVPVAIQATDNQLFNDMRQSQGAEQDAPIVFGADDTEVRFQIFRLDAVVPETYSDFANKIIHTLSTKTSNNQSVTSAALIDDIRPNTNYYYCFRTIDKGGWISNPSPIIRVQVVDDNGRRYPIIEPYDLQLLNPPKTKKSFKKYLEIGASVEEQVVVPIDPDATSAGSPYNLAEALVGPEGGIMRDGPQNKALKIRITSKDTGKKIDLNVDFNVNMIANPNLVEEN